MFVKNVIKDSMGVSFKSLNIVDEEFCNIYQKEKKTQLSLLNQI